MSKTKAVFFFGAGAESPYGMPSGGEFALEIFRTIGIEDKQLLRKEISKIKPTSQQAAWLPDNSSKTNITVFGKNNFDSIISSTLEMRRYLVIDAILSFDKSAEKAKEQFKELGVSIDEVFTNLGSKPGNEQYSNVIKLNPGLLKSFNADSFFGSTYFSVLANLIKTKALEEKFLEDASILARSFIEILIGALGQDLVHSLNNGVFESTPDDLAFLDDIGGIFSIDYRKVGLDALTYILSKKPFLTRQENIKLESDNSFLAVEFFLRVAELIYSNVVDYQGLVDSHYRYLYQPKKEWGKFSKISTFLFAVYRYMKNHLNQSSTQKGYYEDVAEFEDIEVHAIGTSNYTDLVSVIKCEKFFLNGSLFEFYDPYKNEIVGEDYDSLKVPFLFTQSGTKPMTSIKMSRRYIEFYDKSKEADRIIVLGYGFNSDDGHINTLLRSLIDECDKSIDVLDYKCANIIEKQKEISNNIRCSNREKIQIHSINENRKISGEFWLDYLFKTKNE